MLEGEIHHRAPGPLDTPQPGPRIVGVDHRHPRIGKVHEHAAFFRGDGFQCAHAGQMRALGVGDDGHRRLRQPGQRGDFARMVHTHFNDGSAMTGAEPQQGQRQTDVIVEIALRGQHGVAESGTQDAGDHFLGRRLAIAAGDSDERQGEARTPGLRQQAERDACIGNDNQR